MAEPFYILNMLPPHDPFNTYKYPFNAGHHGWEKIQSRADKQKEFSSVQIAGHLSKLFENPHSPDSSRA
jgi:hypothetical protein